MCALQRRPVEHGGQHEHSAADDQPARRDMRRQPGGQHVAQTERQRERDEADAGPQRRVAEHVLHQQADHHRQRQQHPAGQEQRHERHHPVAVVEHRERHQRVVGRALDDQERHEEHHRRNPGADHPRVDPAARWALREHQHRGGAAQRGQQRAGDVEFESFVVGLGEPRHRDPDDDDADRHVDQERQPPGDDGQRTTEHQAQHRTEALHGRRHRHRLVAGVPDGVGRGDQRQPGRGGHRGADALERPRRDERPLFGGQPADQRRQREHADTGDERPLVPDGVTDPPAEQQQAAERQHVGGDHPALARRRTGPARPASAAARR